MIDFKGRGFGRLGRAKVEMVRRENAEASSRTLNAVFYGVRYTSWHIRVKENFGGCQTFLKCPLRYDAKSFTMKYIAANPANNTPLSSVTDIRCNLPNSASNGLSAAVA